MENTNIAIVLSPGHGTAHNNDTKRIVRLLNSCQRSHTATYRSSVTANMNLMDGFFWYHYRIVIVCSVTGALVNKYFIVKWLCYIYRQFDCLLKFYTKVKKARLQGDMQVQIENTIYIPLRNAPQRMQGRNLEHHPCLNPKHICDHLLRNQSYTNNKLVRIDYYRFDGATKNQLRIT